MRLYNAGMDRASPPAVAVVILTWNGKDLTLDCLRSLEAVPTPGLRVVVVDNASSDGTVEAIRGRYGERVEIVETGANLGFAGGNNKGIEHALAGGADLVLLLNNDTVVDPGFVDALAAAMRDAPAVGVAGPKIYYHVPPDRIWFAGGVISMWRGTARHIGIREVDRGQYDRPRDVDYITGCAMMVRRSVFERVGVLDTGYRAYFEDSDFCMRARRAGFGIRYVPSARVWHKISSSTGGQLSRRKITRKLESSVRFFRRYARWYQRAAIPFFFALDVLRIGFLVLTGRIRDSGEHTP